MRITIDHRTVYSYETPARRMIQLLRVTPPSFPGQTVLDWRVDVDVDARLREGRDGYGNVTHMLYVDHPVSRLAISVGGKVMTDDVHGIVRDLPSDLPPLVFLRQTELTALGPGLAAFAARIDEAAGSPIDKLHRLNGELHSAMRFEAGATDTGTKAEEAFAALHGVCQDFAHVFIAAARALHIPARYVSGHLFRRDEADQQAAHAWAEAWLDDLGWVAFDPSHGISTDDAYVRVAHGLDYRDASPVSGTRSGGGAEELDVQVTVRKSRGQSQSQTQS